MGAGSHTAYEEEGKKSPDHELDMKSTDMLRKVTDVCILLIANGSRAVLEKSSCSPFAAESCAMHSLVV